MERTYTVGKVDYHGTGRKNCAVVIEYSLKAGRFSMSGSIWNPRKTDCYSCGQNLEEIAALFPTDRKLQDMIHIWREWHLNDMNAGSPAQEAAVKEWRERTNYVEGNKYEDIKAHLAEIGLDPDPNFIHNGKPYSYGSAWLMRELPRDIEAQILGFPHDGQTEQTPEEADPFQAYLEKRFDREITYLGEENKMDCYTVLVFPKGKKHLGARFDWKQGSGHRKDYHGKPYSEREARSRMSQKYQFSPMKSAPSLKALMDAVIGDARAYAEYGDVAEFMENLGYDDFREARRIWQACEETHNKLKGLLGADFSTLINSDDLPQVAA